MQLQFYAHGAQTADRWMQIAAQFIATETEIKITLPNISFTLFQLFSFFFSLCLPIPEIRYIS